MPVSTSHLTSGVLELYTQTTELRGAWFPEISVQVFTLAWEELLLSGL